MRVTPEVSLLVILSAVKEPANHRYSRQILFGGIGQEGQQKLSQARVLIIGCGALGTAQAESLARAGVGHLKIADRDFVETSNLQRQTMFTEQDALERLPKAIAAKEHLSRINSDVACEVEVVDVNHSNIERLVSDRDLVLDGTDNFSTRFLINDACVKHNVNWIYGAAVGSYGLTMTIRPHQTACLRCVFEELPPAAGAPTCDTAGVIMPIVNIVAAVQVSEALKLLTGTIDSLHGSLMQFDIWRNEWRKINTAGPVDDCETCVLHRYQALSPTGNESVAVLCGRDAIQISPARPTLIDFRRLAESLRSSGDVSFNSYLLRFRTQNFEMTVFQDARSIIRGADDIAAARSIYARFVGN